MRKLGSLLLFPLLLPILNCGTGTSVPPPTPVPVTAQAAASVTGNWEIRAQSAAGSGSTLFGPLTSGRWELNGSLENAGTQITGVLEVLTSTCYFPIFVVPVSGTISAGSDNVSLTSSAVAGQVLTIVGVMSSDRKALLNATYAIEGGCGNGEHGTMTGFLVPSFTNAYTGTFT